MIRKTFLSWLFVALTINVYGLEVHAEQREETALSILITGIDLPDSVVNELNNGLPNRIDVVVNIAVDSKPIQSAVASYSITYDLWDEAYVADIIKPDNTEHLVARTKPELIDLLSNTELSVPMKSDFSSSSRVQAEIIFNPVHKDRIRKIKQWLDKRGSYNRNPTDVSADSGGPGEATGISGSTVGGVRSTGPRFQKLFDQILDEYAESDDVVAQWRSGKVEVPINLN